MDSDLDALKAEFETKIFAFMETKTARSFVFSRERLELIKSEVRAALDKGGKGLVSTDYRRLRAYELLDSGNEVFLIKKRQRPTDGIIYFIAAEDLFHVLHSMHIKLGHRRVLGMANALNKKYANVPRKVLKLFLSLCKVCQENRELLARRRELRTGDRNFFPNNPKKRKREQPKETDNEGKEAPVAEAQDPIGESGEEESQFGELVDPILLPDDYEELSESEEEEERSIIADQNYVVNLGTLTSGLEKVFEHKFKCTQRGRMTVSNATQRGQATTFTYACNKCDDIVRIGSHSEEEKDILDKTVVWGCSAAGVDHTKAKELLGYMGIKMMSNSQFQKQKAKLSKTWPAAQNSPSEGEEGMFVKSEVDLE